MQNPPVQSDATFEEVSQRIWNYLEARDWNKNDPRSVAISLALEAGQLLEHYQWGEESVGSREELGEELADILIYAIQFAHREGIDIPAAIENKLQKVEYKYPAGKFKNLKGEDAQKAWIEVKKNHNKEGL